MAKLKTVKDYVLMNGELYRRMPGGILSRCKGYEETQRKLEEVHNKTCGFCGEVSLYRRLQRAGFDLPNMSKDADLIQTRCEACHLAIDREESYAVFTTEDWRSPFMGYLTEGVLSQKHGEIYKLRKLATHYFLREGIFLRRDTTETHCDVRGQKKPARC